MKSKPRTASVLLSDHELDTLKRGLRVLYRPFTMHWNGQFSKFKEPKQATLVGFEVQDVVHLMKDTGKVILDDDGHVVYDGNDQPKTHKIRIHSRVIRRIHDQCVFPEADEIKHDDLEPGDPCWLLVLGEKVG